MRGLRTNPLESYSKFFQRTYGATGMADGAERGGYNGCANEQSRKGFSEIEGKVAKVATSKSGTRASFKTSISRAADRGELPLLLEKARQFAGQ